MYIADPDYIQPVMRFPYRGVSIQITTGTHLGTPIYTAWVDHATGSAVAVPKAYTKREALSRAKQWVGRHFTF